MSGHRNKKPDDIIKNRQEYLDNLNAQIALQDANEQAVKQYKETGQLPPATQMKDNRTIEDKLRDYEKLKQSIREDLAPIATGQLANLIIQKIQDSPLNQDNGLLVFFAQRAPEIIKNLSKAYKFGIKGDDDDATKFVNFLASIYNDDKKLVLNTKQILKRYGANSFANLNRKVSVQNAELTDLQQKINVILNKLEKVPNLQPGVLNVVRLVYNGKTIFNDVINLLKKIFPDNLIYSEPGLQTISLEQMQKDFSNMMLTESRIPLIRRDILNIRDTYEYFFDYITNNVPQLDFLNVLYTKFERYFNIFEKDPSLININNVKDAFNNIYLQVIGESNLSEMRRAFNALNILLTEIRSTMQPAPAPPGLAGAAPIPGGPLPGPNVPPGAVPGIAYVPYAIRLNYIDQMILQNPTNLSPQEIADIQATRNDIDNNYNLGYINEQQALDQLRELSQQNFSRDPVRVGQGINRNRMTGTGGQGINRNRMTGTGRHTDNLNKWYRENKYIGGKSWKDVSNHDLISLSQWVDDEGKRDDLGQLAHDLLKLRDLANDEQEEYKFIPENIFDHLNWWHYPVEGLKYLDKKLFVEPEQRRIAKKEAKAKLRAERERKEEEDINRELEEVERFFQDLERIRRERNPAHAPADFNQGGGGDAGAGDGGAGGTGIKQKKRMIGHGFKTVPVDTTSGVQTDPRYIKFGRYLINTKRLKDNVLSLRREKGTPIATLPVYKMSGPFSKVVKKIVGGGLPDKEDFNDLTDDEKRYLHRVSKEADLNHKIEIPTPSKDEEEKDIHMFNVYKGEIMAGNDNKEMIRKFKLLIIKLCKKNAINKSEANDILEMLTTAGY